MDIYQFISFDTDLQIRAPLPQCRSSSATQCFPRWASSIEPTYAPRRDLTRRRWSL